MKRVIFIFLAVVPFLTTAQQNILEKKNIGKQLNAWHHAASEANFKEYFSLMTEDAVFMGTDASERWNLHEFKAYSKPHFDKGKAWSFSPIQRNITLVEGNQMAWFDELLKTQMGVCRGSGVVRKEKGTWKIVQYVLSIAIPNEKISEVIQLKTEDDQQLIEKNTNN